MALFAISDLHLSLGTNKPMSVFGAAWEGYEQRLFDNWNSIVAADDFVIMNGDISWATYIEDAKADFDFIESLNGIKYISKGNHDYWWTTAAKQKKFLEANNLKSINFLHNNYFMYENIAICGTKGWQQSGNPDDDAKFFNREGQRLKASILAAQKENPEEIIVSLHYPPHAVFEEIMKDFGVKVCVYGHLHAQSQKYAVLGNVNGINYQLVACDFLSFMPYKIK